MRHSLIKCRGSRQRIVSSAHSFEKIPPRVGCFTRHLCICVYGRERERMHVCATASMRSSVTSSVTSSLWTQPFGRFMRRWRNATSPEDQSRARVSRWDAFSPENTSNTDARSVAPSLQAVTLWVPSSLSFGHIGVKCIASFQNKLTGSQVQATRPESRG